MKNIIILGPPGSGKGTQAKILAEKLGYFYFGTGDLMRQEAQKNTPLGKKFKAVWDRGQGELIAEELVQEFVGKKIKELNQTDKIVFDGYPRTIKQAEHLEKVLGKSDFKVLNIEVPADDLIERMSTRRICESCGKIFPKAQESLEKCDSCEGKLIRREEDAPEVLRKRIEVYEEQTKPLIEYYEKKGQLKTIDGRPSIEEVDQSIRRALDGN